MRLVPFITLSFLTCCGSDDNKLLIDNYPNLKDKIGQVQRTPKGNYFKLLLYSDSTCKIEWGNDKIIKTSTLDLHFNLVDGITFESEDGWLVLKSDKTVEEDCIEIICPITGKEDESWS